MEIPIALGFSTSSTGSKKFFRRRAINTFSTVWGFQTEAVPEDNLNTAEAARKLFDENLATTQRMRSQLPKNRDLIRKIHDFGFQTI